MKTMAICFLLMFWSIQSFSQGPNSQLSATLNTYIVDEMVENNIPGLAACIIKEGKVVWKTALGKSNLELNKDVNFETSFTLASISKLFTATAAALLADQGLLDLDDNINSYLPIQIKNPNHPTAIITTRHLLTHTSSLNDFESDLQLWDAPGDPIYTLSEFCASYFLEGGSFYKSSNFGDQLPGQSSYWYSNAGYTLLGYVIESAAGMPFNEYIKTSLFDPLKMNSAGWFYSEVDSNTMAMPYDKEFTPYGYFSLPEYPAAMMKSNIHELANFLMMYTQKGIFESTGILPLDVFDMIVPANMQSGFAWWGTDTWWGDPQGHYWSHGGFMNGVRTQLNYYPSDSTGLIILTNGEGNYADIQQEIEKYIPQFDATNTSSIGAVENENVQFFPNPISNKDQLNLRFEIQKQRKVKIVDLKGKVMLETMTNLDHVKLNTYLLKQGTYFIHIQEEDNNLFIKKVVIQ